MLTTLDGLRINEDMQVLTADGSVIEGLYAAGDVSGCFYSDNYPEYIVACACGRTCTEGRHVARLLAIDTPPFYGVRTGAWFLATLDGVTIDTNMHPCDENGDPIEGLYLTGNDSGGFFSVSYPNLLTGLACGRTMTFGRRAGMLAATGQA